MKKPSWMLWIGLLICSATGVVLIALSIGGHLWDYAQSRKNYASLRTLAADAQPDGASADGASERDRSSVNFDALSQINPDIVAWLVLNGSAIDYPVVQGTDNEHYLSTGFRGGSSRSGCLFLDVNNAPSFFERNNIIYGHNMRDGSMFGSLTTYLDEARFAKITDQSMLSTLEGDFSLIPFSIYPADAGNDFVRRDFEDDDQWRVWLAEIKAKSRVKPDVPLDAEDRVLTLVTCHSKGGGDRLIMHLLLVQR